MSLTQKQIYDLNNMNVASQNVALGTTLNSLIEGSGGGGGGDVVKIVYDETTMSVEDLGVAVKAVCDAGKIPVIDNVGTVIYLSSSTSEEGYFSAMFVGFSVALDSGTLTTAGIAGLVLEYSEGDGWTLDDGYSDIKLSVR